MGGPADPHLYCTSTRKVEELDCTGTTAVRALPAVEMAQSSCPALICCFQNLKLSLHKDHVRLSDLNMQGRRKNSPQNIPGLGFTAEPDGQGSCGGR